MPTPFGEKATRPEGKRIMLQRSCALLLSLAVSTTRVAAAECKPKAMSENSCNALAWSDASAVCGATADTGGVCFQGDGGQGTYEQACTFCTAFGARLCTQTEISKGVGSGSKCDTSASPPDQVFINPTDFFWSSTTCTASDGNPGHKASVNGQSSAICLSDQKGAAHGMIFYFYMPS